MFKPVRNQLQNGSTVKSNLWFPYYSRLDLERLSMKNSKRDEKLQIEKFKHGF